MGNSLQSPITEMTTETRYLNLTIEERNSSGGSSNSCRWGVSSMQGWRPTMEDTFICQQIDEGVFLFCVCDGHGGTLAAEYAKEHLCQVIWSQQPFQEAVDFISREKESSCSVYDKGQIKQLLQEALENGFVEFDIQLLNHLISMGSYSFPQSRMPQQPQQKELSHNDEEGEWDTALTDLEDYAPAGRENNESSVSPGTTATAVLVTRDFFVCANVGDSRAVLLNKKTGIIELSTDHKPSLHDELKRIEEAGGSVVMGRVDGDLAMSRALGDFAFKTYDEGMLANFESTIATRTDDKAIMERKREVAKHLKVSPFPEIITETRDPENDQLLIVGCDGIFVVVSNKDCLGFVNTIFQEGESDLGLVCEEIINTCLKRGSRDNTTIIVVKLEAQDIGIGGGVKKRRKQRQREGR